MIEIIAVALIVIGIFFIIRGLTEGVGNYDLDYLHHRRYEDDYRRDYRYNSRLKKEKGIEWLDEETEEEFEKKKVKAGGVVLIGPIPIVFGNSKYAVYALILAIALMLLSIFFMFSVNF